MTYRHTALFGLVLLASSYCLLVSAQGQKTGKWIEVRSPNFAVATNGTEQQARKILQHFERIRAVFQKAFTNARVDPGKPVIIIAARDESTLRSLLPEFWEGKGKRRPAGWFVPGPEKNYVALALEVEGLNPYHTIYHEYVHLLNRLNYRRLPLWLDEGFAEFLGSTMIGDKEAQLGLPIDTHVSLLRQSRLLPLETLFQVDQRSPHYSEANKVSIFYAEAWALTHYLMLEEQTGKSKPLDTFLALLREEVDEIEAARRAFGDLKLLERNLQDYTARFSFRAYQMKLAPQEQLRDFEVRDLSPGESAALRGDFLLHMRRPAEARTLLEEAIRLDPNLAAPRASMGLLAQRSGNEEEALKWFTEAVQLDAHSFLAHYYHAVLATEGPLTPERIQIAEAGLRKALELNPNFAPAYAALAQFYALRGDRLEEALALAKKAAQLEPGTTSHYLTLANVLLRMMRADEAIALGQQVAASARSDDERAAAEVFLNNARRLQSQFAERRRKEEELRRLEAQDQKEEAARAQQEAARPAEAKPKVDSKPPEAPQPAQEQTAPGEGRVVAVSCSGSSLDLTLDYYGFALKLHAEDVAKIAYTPTRWQQPKNFNPCVHLKGLMIRAEYKAVAGKPYSGEIVSVAIQP